MASGSGGTSQTDESTDRISMLPDEIREHILGHLPITDAVKTSILKKKWRHSWKRVSQLNLYFDEDLERDMSEDAYYRMVGRVLLAHFGPIRKISLRPLWYDMEGDVYIWLELLSRKGIQDLTINCEDRIDIEWFDLPASLFYCVGLSSLSLGRCKLVNSFSFSGFPNLIKLELFEVGIYEDILERIISSCRIEILILRSCNFNYHKTAIHAPNLRIFNITCCYFGLDYTYVKYSPNLKVASFMLEMDEDIDDLKSNCFDAFGSMSKIEVLTFDIHLHKTSDADIIPEKLPNLLENLRTVTFYKVDAISVDKMSFMFCIIRSSPNLRNLDIHMTDKYRKRCDEKSLKAATTYVDVVCEEEMKTSLTTLSVTIELVDNAECIEVEIAFITSIVSCSPSLITLFIKASPTIQCSAKLQLSRALERFGPSSNKPQIICSSGSSR